MEKRGKSSSMAMKLFVLLCLGLGALCQINGAEFRAFYFMQQWLGSYCNQAGTQCCYPTTGKPKADFTVYGLWPYFSDSSFPTNCPGGSFDVDPLKPIQGSLEEAWPTLTCPLIGRKFWLHEWNKHGVCTSSMLGELDYFKASIDLKNKINILEVLANAGIRPDNKSYQLNSIKDAVTRAFGFQPWVTCNHDAKGQTQIWQITLCVESSGSKLVECPSIPKDSCTDAIIFPSF